MREVDVTLRRYTHPYVSGRGCSHVEVNKWNPFVILQSDELEDEEDDSYKCCGNKCRWVVLHVCVHMCMCVHMCTRL